MGMQNSGCKRKCHGLNLSPGTGLNSWFLLLKDSQSVTHLRQTVYAPVRKVPQKTSPLSMELGEG